MPDWRKILIAGPPSNNKNPSRVGPNDSTKIFTMADREECVYMAKLAEQAERYDEMVRGIPGRDRGRSLDDGRVVTRAREYQHVDTEYTVV